MTSPPSIPRYNHRIPHMRARASSGMRLGWLTIFLLATVSLPSNLCASSLGDTARQLAHQIAADAGPGAFAIEITNHSSLDDKSVREISSELETQLQVEGVRPAKADQSIGTIAVVLSESLRDYVWTAEIMLGSDDKKVAMVSSPRPPSATPSSPLPPIVIKTTLLFAQEQPMLDVAQIEVPGGSRLLVLNRDMVAIYRPQALNQAARWGLETSLPIVHSRVFPRDLRGRIFLRRDHLFDVYLPGTSCRSSSNTATPLTLTCNDAEDATPNNLWPLTSDDGSVRAIFAASRNFFTGSVSPAIGNITNVGSFYSAAALPRSNYTLWAFAAVNGSLHLVDGMTDQMVRAGKWGSEMATVHSGCGLGTQLLVSENGSPTSGNSERDNLRAFEVPDREPVLVSSAAEFGGRIVALWTESGDNNATAIVKRSDTGWYEAFRVSITCGN